MGIYSPQANVEMKGNVVIFNGQILPLNSFQNYYKILYHIFFPYKLYSKFGSK